jgi:hypothetical protein
MALSSPRRIPKKRIEVSRASFRTFRRAEEFPEQATSRRAPALPGSGARAARGEAGRRLVSRAMALTCVVCRGEDFDETEEGFYVCHLCGTQSQDVVREVEDEELQFNTAGAGIARGARRVRTPGRRGDALGAARGAGPRDGTYGATPAGPGSREDAQRRVSATSEESRAALGRVVAYCDGLQRLLQAQCDALVQTMGFPESIRLETRKVWLAYLDGSKILETDFADPNAFLENDAAAAERTARSSRARPPDAGTDASASASASSSEEDDDDGTDDDAEELRRSFGGLSDARRDLRRRREEETKNESRSARSSRGGSPSNARSLWCTWRACGCGCPCTAGTSLCGPRTAACRTWRRARASPTPSPPANKRRLKK